jgi:hypothetical protein
MPSATIIGAIETMTKNRERFEEFCRSLTEEELARAVPPDDKWTVRDFIIHLLTFEDLMAEWVRGMLEGKTSLPTLADGSAFDIDKWNDERVEEWRGRSLDELFAEAARERENFAATLGRLTDEQIAQVMHFPGDNKRDGGDVPIGLFIVGLARHDPIHVADMVKALPERAGDPGLQAWLDDRMVSWYQQAMAGPPKR